MAKLHWILVPRSSLTFPNIRKGSRDARLKIVGFANSVASLVTLDAAEKRENWKKIKKIKKEEEERHCDKSSRSTGIEHSRKIFSQLPRANRRPVFRRQPRNSGQSRHVCSMIDDRWNYRLSPDTTIAPLSFFPPSLPSRTYVFSFRSLPSPLFLFVIIRDTLARRPVL